MSDLGERIEVNGLAMYYEVHGDGPGRPLVLLHGGFGSAADWGQLLPALTPGRRVLAVEQQAHAHTPDRDAPLTYEQMADDTAALIRQLRLGPVDVFGYSDGGMVALGMAIRHPDVVHRLAVIGAVAGTLADTYEPETYEQFLSISPATFNVPILKEPYERVAPDPAHWPVLVEKILSLGRDFAGYAPANIASIAIPTLLMFGDSEGIRLEHAVELKRAIPDSRLAIFPGADHFYLHTNTTAVLSMLIPFLDAESPS